MYFYTKQFTSNLWSVALYMVNT